MTFADIAGKIESAAPLLATLLGGPAVGEGVALLSHALGAKPDADSIAAALSADPAALEKVKALELQNQVQLQALIVQAAANKLAADTARISSVNTTMQAEVAKGRGWWRELFGYISALMFGLEVGAAIYVVVCRPVDAGAASNLIGALMMLWGVPMAVLGISAWHDGATQRIQAGDTSLSAALAAKWGAGAS